MNDSLQFVKFGSGKSLAIPYNRKFAANESPVQQMKIFVLFLSFCLWASVPAISQSPIVYTVSCPNVAHHEINVSIVLAQLPLLPLEIRMPQASPGRYAQHHFAKNLYQVKAFDANGQALPIVKTDIASWVVGAHQGYVKITYTLFGNRADGTYAGFNNRFLHLNMPAVFPYAVGLERRPVELIFDIGQHPDWRVATQLEQLSPTRFRAPDYYYFYDSPTIVGDIRLESWESRSKGEKYTIELAMLHQGTDKELSEYVKWAKRIVEEQKEIFGELPAFDFGRYTFLCSYNPWVDGDGMEHRNSTICTSESSLAENAKGLIGTLSHEFFHSWNVERLRPRSLEPFNFDQPNMSGELWFAEGFTTYYGNLILCRAEIISDSAYILQLERLLNTVVNAPGRQWRGPYDMSCEAPFTDAAVFIDPDNHYNTFLSYYPYGATIGLCLDLSLRKDYQKTLDDYMRYLWEHYGRTAIPYTMRDLQDALSAVADDSTFAQHFFEQYIYGHELPDLKPLLAEVGIGFELKRPGKAGFYPAPKFNYSKDGAVLKTPVPATHPLYAAGIEQGDKLLAVNDQAIHSDFTFDKVSWEIGQTYTLTFEQNGIVTTGMMKAVQDPELRCTMLEKVKPDVPNNALKKRAAWLH